MNILLMPYQKEIMSQIIMLIPLWMSPLKLFEYMASNKPIVSSNLYGIREVLKGI